ncbi:cobyrinic acid a,c-diamide synthase [Sphingomonas sp. Root710]|uniref:AAA family ATPase n=1 Tax=Sphingomonas sp. Root710 TaxID=1736594 RepID=UPI0006F2EF38|nr:AAA family ATPase [Sphingomonas sp. Root710]KRB86671.1 cobyrinic acid a,c-diamide synthase [Sphingomonas sp. Root710]
MTLAPSIPVLRDLPGTAHLQRSARVISIACGRSGVGKTTIAANLALSLSKMHRRAMLVDCDPGPTDATRQMGFNPKESIDDVIGGRLTIDEIVVDGPEALFVVPAGPVDAAGRVDLAARLKLADAFRPHRRSLDYVIVDTPGSADPDTLDMVASADLPIVVLAPDAERFMDAYGTVKLLALDHGVRDIAIVTNRIADEAMGRELFRRFREVTGRFLTDTTLSYLGGVPKDERVLTAAARRRLVVDQYPNARAAQAIGHLARTIDTLDIGAQAGGDCFFGMEAVLRAG